MSGKLYFTQPEDGQYRWVLLTSKDNVEFSEFYPNAAGMYRDAIAYLSMARDHHTIEFNGVTEGIEVYIRKRATALFLASTH